MSVPWVRNHWLGKCEPYHAGSEREAARRARFGFSHYEGVTGEQSQEIETIGNDEIRRNSAADTNVMSYDEAIESGAMALFGEKYGEVVESMYSSAPLAGYQSGTF